MAILSVRHTPASAAIARRNVADALQRAGLTSDQAFDAALIASELVGNAVRHGRPLPSGNITVEWQLSAESYYIGVTDGGTARAVAPKDADVLDTNGRGLMIVAALSQEWGVNNNENTTTVWAQAGLNQDANAQHSLQSI
ncbi:MAG TPA: ATP-binding protein [Jatrophihabitans sp.]|nr:ATP-binding protein [Jatrophihabitans sp.]